MLIFHPRVEADVRSAMASYDERSSGLGLRFKRTFYRTIDSILLFPLKGAVKIDGVIRTQLMRPFPYLIFYVAENTAVTVISVQYAGRKPAYLRTLVRERFE